MSYLDAFTSARSDELKAEAESIGRKKYTTNQLNQEIVKLADQEIKCLEKNLNHHAKEINHPLIMSNKQPLKYTALIDLTKYVANDLKPNISKPGLLTSLVRGESVKQEELSEEAFSNFESNVEKDPLYLAHEIAKNMLGRFDHDSFEHVILNPDPIETKDPHQSQYLTKCATLYNDADKIVIFDIIMQDGTIYLMFSWRGVMNQIKKRDQEKDERERN